MLHFWNQNVKREYLLITIGFAVYGGHVGFSPVDINLF